jgi:putative membrane protein
MMFYGNGMNGWAMLLMTVSSLLFWGLVVAGIVALVRYPGRNTSVGANPADPRSTPQQILAERFARGEIDEDEYRRRLQVLGA